MPGWWFHWFSPLLLKGYINSKHLIGTDCLLGSAETQSWHEIVLKPKESSLISSGIVDSEETFSSHFHRSSCCWRSQASSLTISSMQCPREDGSASHLPHLSILSSVVCLAPYRSITFRQADSNCTAVWFTCFITSWLIRIWSNDRNEAIIHFFFFFSLIHSQTLNEHLS